MKMKRDHRVPLCGRVVELLDEARTLGDAGPLVFPAPGDGVRGWAAEETDHPREVIEAALAHVVQNKVEAAYTRSDLFERRRRLMDDWAAYLAASVVHAERRRPGAGAGGRPIRCTAPAVRCLLARSQ